MDSTQLSFSTIFILSFLYYLIFEYFFRQLVLTATSLNRDISLPFITSFKPLKVFWWKLIFILSPGLWVSQNCKEFIKSEFPCVKIQKYELSKFIKTSNCWNIIISFVVLVITLLIEEIFPDTNHFKILVLGFVMWRYISRNFEILVAFGKDVLSSDSSSDLDNQARMKLAVISYFEIFIYSAAFYSAYSCSLLETHESILTSLFVGTLTNVSDAIKLLTCNLTSDSCYMFWLKLSVYLQVFATLSLIFFALAGYFSRVKSNTIKF